MVDTSKVVDKIQGRSLAESPQLRRHRGVVQSRTSDTLGITLDGGSTVITGVRKLADVSVNVGDTVEVIGDDTDLFIIGRIDDGGVTQPSVTHQYNPGVTGVLISDVNGTAHSWLPYTNGSFYFTSRPDAGEGKWVFRTFDGVTYSTKLEISSGGVLSLPLYLGTTSFYAKTSVDGYRLAAFSDQSYIEFTRSGSHDRVRITANDSVYLGGGDHAPAVVVDPGSHLVSTYAYNNTTAEAVNLNVHSADNVFRRSTSSLRYKQGWEYKYDLADIVLPDPIAWEGRPDTVDEGKSYVGFGAEHVAEVLPEGVSYDEDGEPDNIDLRAIVAVLTAQVKQLQNRVKELEDANS